MKDNILNRDVNSPFSLSLSLSLSLLYPPSLWFTNPCNNLSISSYSPFYLFFSTTYTNICYFSWFSFSHFYFYLSTSFFFSWSGSEPSFLSLAKAVPPPLFEAWFFFVATRLGVYFINAKCRSLKEEFKMPKSCNINVI